MTHFHTAMHRPLWNKSQAIWQVISLKALLEPSEHDDSSAIIAKKFAIVSTSKNTLIMSAYFGWWENERKHENGENFALESYCLSCGKEIQMCLFLKRVLKGDARVLMLVEKITMLAREASESWVIYVQ